MRRIFIRDPHVWVKKEQKWVEEEVNLGHGLKMLDRLSQAGEGWSDIAHWLGRDGP